VSAAPWAAHFGLARTPFGKSIAARDLFPRQAHAEAIARISFCVVECALGVVTGDVGAGKTVALRAAAVLVRDNPALARSLTPVMPDSLRNTGPGYLRWRREALERGDVAALQAAA